jgi:hypothetical protein
MTIENHVVSLQTAKRMKSLGWDYKECLFVYDYDSRKDGYDIEFTATYDYHPTSENLPAPLATEIVEELPGNIVVDEGDPENQWIYWLGIHKLTDEYEVFYDHYDVTKQSASHENLAEALALLWCELKEKGII